MEVVPKSFGDNLSEWFRAMGRSWRPLLTFSLVVFVPIAVLLAVFTVATGADQSMRDLFLADPDLIQPDEAFDLIVPLILGLSVLVILQSLGGLLVYVASARTWALSLNGITPTAAELWSHVLSRIASVVAASVIILLAFVAASGLVAAGGWAVISNFDVSFLTVFVTTVGVLTALVVMIWLSVSVSMFPPVISSEGSGAARSLARSFDLVKGRWWPTLGYVAVAGIIASSAIQIISVAIAPLFLLATAIPALFAVGYGLITILQGPLNAALGLAYGIWYTDLRARTGPLTPEELI